MPAAPLLSQTEIRAALAELPEWQLADDRLVRQLHFPDFAAALAFVNLVAGTADELDHHPDVAIQWGDLTLKLWTHAAGGVTRRDLRLAMEIEALVRSR
ncbi:MAG TPA: 4a-hydroxytetrahydrobiopterin dehydratase [Candidatus Caenarcaniphilales bacterium]|nr:4a-hydroxytetrahydrobiopterin dehydratase [Candidatus Caenarcaniphilales bacterium]